MDCVSKHLNTEIGKPMSSPRLVLNTYQGRNIAGETFVADHIFSYIISGKQDIWLGGKKYSFNEGDFRFFRRNQLSKYIKSPGEDGFRSIAVHIDQYTLKQMSTAYTLKADPHYTEDAPLLLQPDIALREFVKSVKPYLEQQVQDPRIVSLKTKELILLLIDNNPSLKNILFDFNEPGKIDLEAFMNSNYRYNVDIDRFAFLTGRSLSSFKRDFAKIYNISPRRWLVKKRLQEAQISIEEHGQKPTDVYLDLGFENLSHFSYAYKKAFGYAPSKVDR